jgi:hypothetical protein
MKRRSIFSALAALFCAKKAVAAEVEPGGYTMEPMPGTTDYVSKEWILNPEWGDVCSRCDNPRPIETEFGVFRFIPGCQCPRP